MKNMLKVIFTIIGTIIGAGFASGQEITLFFEKYGVQGIIGLLFSCFLTGIIIYKVFSISQKKQICHYNEFLSEISKNKKMNEVLQIIIHLFLLISFYVMLAGFCSYFKQTFQIPILISNTAVAFLCYFTFQKDTKGIIYINTYLIPILILFISYLGLKNIHFTISYYTQNEILWNYNASFLFSSILYASYNSIVLVPILLELHSYLENSKMLKKVVIFSSVFLSFLGIIIFSLLLRVRSSSIISELPLLEVVKEFGKIYPWFYGFAIISAIFTSAISAGYGFLKNVSKNQKQYKKLNIFLCISSIFIVQIGFSKLVNTLYPIFGILGLIQIFLILKHK